MKKYKSLLVLIAISVCTQVMFLSAASFAYENHRSGIALGTISGGTQSGDSVVIQPDVYFMTNTTIVITVPNGDTSANIQVTLNSAILVNGSTDNVDTLNVVLQINATVPTDGVTYLQLSNDGVTWSELVTYNPTNPTYNWTLLPGDGVKTIYVRFKTPSDALTTPFTQMIVLKSPLVEVASLPSTGLVVEKPMAYPTIFDPGKEHTRIYFKLDKESDCTLFIYDTAGQLIHKETSYFMEQYPYFDWNGDADYAAGELANGVYLFYVARNAEGRKVIARGKVFILRGN